jgi:hypothetical protein
MKSRRAGAVLLAVSTGFAGGTVAACNAIVGAGDYKVGIADGSVMDAPASDVSTMDRQSAETGSGKDAGDAGDADVATGPVTCGSGLPVNSTAFQEAVSTCLLSVSCDPYFFQTTMSTCISEDYLHSIGYQACLTTISSCAGFSSCTGLSIPTATQCPNSGVTTAFCASGNNAVNCGADSNQASAVQACQPVSCGTYMDDAGVIASCVVEPSCPTSQEDGLFHCNTTTNNLYQCIGGKGFGQNCGTNSTCIEDPVNGTSCYFNGTACTTAGYTCGSGSSSNVLEWCTSDKVLFNFNCNTAGLTCAVDTTTSSGYCLAPGCSVSDYNNCTESCATDGHTALLCIGGAQYSVDCAKHGFTSCVDSITNGIYCSN